MQHLAKSVLFCLFPITRVRLNCKNSGLISLAEAVSRQHNVEFVEWLLLIAFLQEEYSEIQKQKGQEET